MLGPIPGVLLLEAMGVEAAVTSLVPVLVELGLLGALEALVPRMRTGLEGPEYPDFEDAELGLARRLTLTEDVRLGFDGDNIPPARDNEGLPEKLPPR